jgi:hypothetical protein
LNEQRRHDGENCSDDNEGNGDAEGFAMGLKEPQYARKQSVDRRSIGDCFSLSLIGDAVAT